MRIIRIIRKITPIHIFILTLSIILIHKIVQSDWTPMLFLVIGAAILDFGLMLLVDYFLCLLYTSDAADEL